MPMTTQPLTLSLLQSAVAGGAVALRARTRLQPAGGPGDKVFPPSYLNEHGPTKYAMEERVLDGRRVRTVLLDSVQSQANRMEEALKTAWDDGEADFPVIVVDFTGESDLEDLDRITTLDMPHRIADAILRDSITSEGTLFRNTPAGLAYTNARVTNATAVYINCPTALVFGVWDSTGPKGGSGAKFARVLVSEIVGVDAQTGTKTSSRIDPLAIQAVPVYESAANPDDWTPDPDLARKDGKSKAPVPFSRKGEGSEKGKASAVNHSNVVPQLDDKAGGVTVDHALQTSVLSLVALRRLRFPIDGNGAPIDREHRGAAELAARTAIAALGIAGMVLQREFGQDLRSRCLLVPEGPTTWELLPRDGGATQAFQIDRVGALALLREAAASAAATGLAWTRSPATLKPAPKLAELIRRSRLHALKSGASE